MFILKQVDLPQSLVYSTWVTLSPKRFKKPLSEVYEYVDELKVVVLTNKDIEWAESEAQRCPKTTRLYLQPEWDTRIHSFNCQLC